MTFSFPFKGACLLRTPAACGSGARRVCSCLTWRTSSSKPSSSSGVRSSRGRGPRWKVHVTSVLLAAGGTWSVRAEGPSSEFEDGASATSGRWPALRRFLGHQCVPEPQGRVSGSAPSSGWPPQLAGLPEAAPHPAVLLSHLCGPPLPLQAPVSRGSCRGPLTCHCVPPQAWRWGCTASPGGRGRALLSSPGPVLALPPVCPHSSLSPTAGSLRALRGKGPASLSLSRPWEGARVSVPPLGRRPALSPPPHSSPGENGPAPLVLVLREAPLGEAPVLVMARVSGRLPEPSGQLLAAGRGRVSPRPQRAARAVPGAAWCPPSGTGVGPCPGPVPSQPQRGGVPCGQERSLPHAFLLAARFHFLRFPEPQHPGRWVLRRGERGWRR